MNITYTYRHTESSTAMEERLSGHLHKMDKYLPQKVDIHCIFTVDGHRNIVELNVKGSHIEASAHDSKEDMYKAIDSAWAKLEKQIIRLKEKRQAR